MTRTFNRLPRQRGATLLVTLIMLAVMLMLGVSAALMSNFDERMARNARDKNVALQAAEAALRDARQDILKARALQGGTGATANCDATGFKGFCLPAPDGSDPVWVANAPLDGGGPWVRYGEITKLSAAQTLPDAEVPGGVAHQPRYLIEAIPDPDGASLKAPATRQWVYRITAIGWGALPGTEVMIQEVIRP